VGFLIRFAIDPGDTHVGLAWFEDGECAWAQEKTPADFLLWLESQMINNFVKAYRTEIVCEEFRLYPWRMQEQGFSQMRTAELIGAIRWITRGYDLIMQPASVKKVVVAQAKERGYTWKSRGHGGHAKDAESHGLYRIWKLAESKEDE
jgi:hypothetical protein